MNKLKKTSINFLKTGLSPAKIAAAVSLGVAVGIFPILGPFSLLCALLGTALGLNVPIALAGYYAMTLIQPLMIIPFLRIGESIFQSDPMLISPVELSQRFFADASGTLADFGWSFVHATVGWLALLPVLACILFPLSIALVRYWKRGISALSVITITALAQLFILTPSSQAWSLSSSNDEGIFAQTTRVSNQMLNLQGAGKLKYKKLITVYDAALYKGNGGTRRLVVIYRVNAKASQFTEAGLQILERNHDPDTIASMQKKLDALNAWYPDTRKGDTCSITHIPGKGIELEYNGTILGSIPDDAFSDYYFSIWLGDKPASKKLKKRLLNRANSSS